MSVVVKLGGHVLDDLSPTSRTLRDLASDIQSTSREVVVVHGGGPQIASLLNALQKPSIFHEGLRVTDDDTMNVVAMALSQVNVQIVAALNQSGLRAVGVSGADAGLLRAQPLGVAWGRAATSPRVDSRLIRHAINAGYVPVVCPLACDDDGNLLNCNADTAAGAIAASMGADLILLSDVDQVRRQADDPSSGLARVTREEIDQMIVSGAIRDGMTPKVRAALDALAGGATRVVMANGSAPHAFAKVQQGELVSTVVEP